MDASAISAVWHHAQRLPEPQRAPFLAAVVEHYATACPPAGRLPPLEQFDPPLPAPRPPTRRRCTAVDGLGPEDVAPYGPYDPPQEDSVGSGRIRPLPLDVGPPPPTGEGSEGEEAAPLLSADPLSQEPTGAIPPVVVLPGPCPLEDVPLQDLAGRPTIAIPVSRGPLPALPARPRPATPEEGFAQFQAFEEFRLFQQFERYQSYQQWRHNDGMPAAPEPSSGLSEWSTQAVSGWSPRSSEVEGRRRRTASGGAAPTRRGPSPPPGPPMAMATDVLRPASGPFPPAASGLWEELRLLVEENPQHHPFLEALAGDLRHIVRDDGARPHLARLCARLRAGVPLRVDDRSLSDTPALLAEYLATLFARDPDPSPAPRPSGTPQTAHPPATTPLSTAPPSRPGLGPPAWHATPPTTPGLPAALRAYASSEDFLRLLSDRMLGLVSPTTPQTSDGTAQDYNAQLSAHLALLKLTLSDLQRERPGGAGASPNRGPVSAGWEGTAATPLNTPAPHPMALTPAPSSVALPLEDGVLQGEALRSLGTTPPPTAAITPASHNARTARPEELGPRLVEGLRRRANDVEEVGDGHVDGPPHPRRLGPSEGMAVPRNTPVCQSPAVRGAVHSPVPLSPLNAGKEALGCFSGGALLAEAGKVPAQTPPSTPALPLRPPAPRTAPLEMLTHRLVERLQGVELADRAQAAARAATTRGVAEQEELWREYHRALYTQALGPEPDRLLQLLEPARTRPYPVVVAHREALRQHLGHLAAVRSQGKGPPKFDAPTLSSVAAALRQLVELVLAGGLPSPEFRAGLDLAVAKYDGCDIAGHKDRLLQDAYDAVCDEMLLGPRACPRPWAPSGAAEPLAKASEGPPRVSPRAPLEGSPNTPATGADAESSSPATPKD